MIKLFLIASLFLMSIPSSADRTVIVPKNGAKPVGPYSPGLLVGDYLYASGQGVRDANGVVPAGLKAQTRQCLENVKAIVEGAGLTMQHVVHMQLYLEKMSDLAEVDVVYAEYFPKTPPARVIIGTAKMPTDTNVEMTAVAVKDLKTKKTLVLKSLKPIGRASSAVATGNRVYLSAVYGKTKEEADTTLQKVIREAKLGAVVFRNEYGLTAQSPIPMHELPNQMASAISAIALYKSDAGNQPGGCAVDGKTIFCEAVAAPKNETEIQADVRAVFRQLQSVLASRGANFSHVVATNVYLNDIRQFKDMNDVYATYFSNTPPTRTTVQPFPIIESGARPLVRISLVAVAD
jgi:2-iminobutanoate/2-iminopropanoate deaminase